MAAEAAAPRPDYSHLYSVVRLPEEDFAHPEVESEAASAWTCSICMDKTLDAALEECGHIFHHESIMNLNEKVVGDRWIRECPHCRAAFSEKKVRVILDGKKDRAEHSFLCKGCKEPVYQGVKGVAVIFKCAMQRFSYQFRNEQRKVELPVGHLFHKDCLVEKLDEQGQDKKCPHCDSKQEREPLERQAPQIQQVLFRNLRQVHRLLQLEERAERIDDVRLTLGDCGTVIATVGLIAYAIFMGLGDLHSTVIADAVLNFGVSLIFVEEELYGLALACNAFSLILLSLVSGYFVLAQATFHLMAAGFCFEIGFTVLPYLTRELWN